eukprot:5191348-Amphidinium_carterae.1
MLAHGFDFGTPGTEWDVVDLRFFAIWLGEDEGPSVYALAVYNKEMDIDTWCKREHVKAHFEMGQAKKVQIRLIKVDIIAQAAQLEDHQDLRGLLTEYHRQIMEFIDWTLAEDMKYTSFLMLRLDPCCLVVKAEQPHGVKLDINGMQSADASDATKEVHPQLPEEPLTLNILRMEFANRYHTWT